MLSLSDLNVFYGRAQALFGVSLEVGAGEAVALMGRNGAGKSTTLKAAMGLIPTAGGLRRFDGRDLAGLEPHAVARLGLGYVPEERRIFAGLDVAGNLEVGRRPPRPDAPAWTPERLFELFPNLAGKERRLGGTLSGGEQKMLAIARTLMGNPRLVLLDEPTEGLAPLVVEQMTTTIASLKAEGLALLMSEQNLRFATALADRAYIIESGRIVAQGAMADLVADRDLWRRHLAV